MAKTGWIVGLLCIILMIAACSNNNEPAESGSGAEEGNGAATSSETPSSAPQEPEAGAMDKLLTISYLGSNFQNAVEGDIVQTQLEEKFNIKLEDRKVNNNDTTQVDLMLASGEMPDGAWLGGDPKQRYEQGITRTIPRELIEKYAPNYANMLNSHPLGWQLHQLPGSDGEYLALTGLFDLNAIYFVPNYRLDWLEQLGIKPNGTLTQLDDEGRIWLTDEPFTQEQHFDILRRFAADDPDNNGAKDTFGMSAVSTNGYDNYSWSAIMGMFGLPYAGEHYSNIEENGQTVNFYVSSAYKDFLRYMRSLYEAGAIDPEFATTDWNRFQEKAGASQIGYWNTDYGYFSEKFIDRAPMIALNNAPGAKILVAPPERGSSGAAGTNRYGWNPFNYTFFVGEQVDDEKLIRLLQLFDYMNFDEAAQIWSRFGEEGVHFTWEGEPRKSAAVLTERADEIDSYRGHYIRLPGSWIYELPVVAGKINDYTEGPWAEQYGIYPLRVDPLKQTGYSDLVAEYGESLQTIRREFLYKVITGQTNLDAEWDNYVNMLNNAGLTQLHEELQHMPLISEFVGN